VDTDIGLLNIVIIGIVLIIGIIVALIYKFLIKPRRKVNISTTFANSPETDGETSDYLPATLPAYVWRRTGIKAELIQKPIGSIWFADPSLPISGPCYLCTVDKNDKLVAYDPRVAGIEEGNAPQDLYEAILCPEVEAVYVSLAGLWDKIKTLIPYVIAAGLLLIALAMTDNIGG